MGKYKTWDGKLRDATEEETIGMDAMVNSVLEQEASIEANLPYARLDELDAIFSRDSERIAELQGRPLNNKEQAVVDEKIQIRLKLKPKKV